MHPFLMYTSTNQEEEDVLWFLIQISCGQMELSHMCSDLACQVTSYSLLTMNFKLYTLVYSGAMLELDILNATQ